ncbi:MAG: DALR domain-containing protein, partial [Oscillospiraceae bacterium]
VMDDDLNTADAVAVIFELVREMNSAVCAAKNPTRALAKACDDVFSELAEVIGLPILKAETNIDAEIEGLIEARTAARKAKNFAEADKIRDELKNRGIELEDTPNGVKWHNTNS